MKVNTTVYYPSIWSVERSQSSKSKDDTALNTGEKQRNFDRIFGDLIAMGYSVKDASAKARRLYYAWPETALLAKCEDRACQGTVAEKTQF